MGVPHVTIHMDIIGVSPFFTDELKKYDTDSDPEFR